MLLVVSVSHQNDLRYSKCNSVGTASEVKGVRYPMAKLQGLSWWMWQQIWTLNLTCKCQWENFPFLSTENTFENIISTVEVKGNLGFSSSFLSHYLDVQDVLFFLLLC